MSFKGIPGILKDIFLKETNMKPPLATHGLVNILETVLHYASLLHCVKEHQMNQEHENKQHLHMDAKGKDQNAYPNLLARGETNSTLAASLIKQRLLPTSCLTDQT